MADRNAEQDNLFKEIDEDLRQQRYADLWNKYGKFIIGSSIALVIAVASIKGWEAYDLNRKATDSSLLTTALELIDRKNPENATAILDNLSKDGSEGYSIIAKFSQAAMLAKNGDHQKAIESYLLIAEDSRVESLLRDMASIKSAYLGLEHSTSEKLLKKLSTLVNVKNAWRHSAKELSALFAQKSGNDRKAHRLFKELADDPTAPIGMRSRAAEMATILNEKIS